MNGFVRSFPCGPFLLLSSIACFSVFASEDDYVVDRLDENSTDNELPGAQVQRLVVIRDLAIARNGAPLQLQFEKMIFSQDGSAQLGHQRIKADREQAINALDRAVQLTDLQKRKLDLAGQVDHQRFLDRFKAASQIFCAQGGWTKEDQKVIRQLEAKATNGLIGPDSFFMKSIPVTLNNNQLALLNERKRSIHSSMIKKALRDFDARLTLSERQRESLTQIMLDQIPYDPTSENGELLVSRSEQMTMMYRLSCIANEKIEPLFAPIEWHKVQPMLEQCYHYKEYLIERRLLDPEADVVNADDGAIRIKEPK